MIGSERMPCRGVEGCGNTVKRMESGRMQWMCNYCQAELNERLAKSGLPAIVNQPSLKIPVPKFRERPLNRKSEKRAAIRAEWGRA